MDLEELRGRRILGATGPGLPSGTLLPKSGDASSEPQDCLSGWANVSHLHSQPGGAHQILIAVKPEGGSWTLLE